MDKRLLVRFIDGEADDQGREEVLKWIEKDPQNKQYYFYLKNLLAIGCAEYVDEIYSDSNDIGKKKEIGKQVKWRVVFEVAACLLLFIAVGFSIYFYQKANTPAKDMLGEAVHYDIDREAKQLSFYTNKGVKGFVVLPDSSKVWLNSDTRITYPEFFRGSHREVAISGEAFFDVVKNPDTAMLVTTNKGLKIEVLGTQFLIRSYDNDNDAQATLFTGRIKLTTKKSNSSKEVVHELRPQESLLIPDDSKAIKLIPKADTLNSIAWKRGKLVFDETPVEEVIKKLERWHGVEFVITDRAILSYKITAQFKSESIIQIMEIIRYCSPIEYKVENDKIYLSKR